MDWGVRIGKRKTKLGILDCNNWNWRGRKMDPNLKGYILNFGGKKIRV